MRKFLIVGLFGLTACAVAGGATPKAMELSNSKIKVAMSDGTTCTADWDVTAGPASGQLGNCPHELSYAIQPDEQRNILRRGFEHVYTAIGLLDQAVGFGAVEITDASGEIYRFKSPK